jgi:hypothetical protein
MNGALLLTRMPVELFGAIRNFLVNDDDPTVLRSYYRRGVYENWRNFLNSSKLLMEAKRKYVIYYFHTKTVLESRYFQTEQKQFLQFLNRTLASTRNSIAIDFFDTATMDYFCDQMPEKFQNLYLCDLLGHDFDDVEPFGFNNYCLNLEPSRSSRIEDVSCLGEVKVLNLKYFPYISDVSMLKNCQSLNLSHCRDIVDVSMLGNVKKLHLRGCYKISDIRSLCRVEWLDISGCFGIIHGLPVENQLKTLFFSDKNNVNWIKQLKNKDNIHLKSQFLPEFHEGGDYDFLKEFSFLTFHSTLCKPDFMTMSNLIGVRRLSFFLMRSLTKIENLEHLRTLEIEMPTPPVAGSELDIDFKTLPSLQILLLKSMNCPEIHLVNSMSYVRIVRNGTRRIICENEVKILRLVGMIECPVVEKRENVQKFLFEKEESIEEFERLWADKN